MVGQCQLILQPNEGAYQWKLSAMQQERIAENQEPEENMEEGELSRDLVMENFQLKDNPTLKCGRN